MPSLFPALSDSDENLRKLARVKHRTVPVKLMVSVNKLRQVYEVSLEGDSYEEQFEFSRTSELVRFLRSPIRQGEGYRSKGNTLTWDHRNDIVYNEDSISFLIPLIHRSRFYPAEYQYPPTCKALMATKQGAEVSMIIKRNGNGFGILFENLPSNSSLSLLEDATFSKSTLMLLTECEELFDYNAGIRHPVNLNITDIQDIRFPGLSEGSRLSQAFQTCTEEAYFETEQESQFSSEDAGEDALTVAKQRKVGISMTEQGQTFSYKGLELSGKRIVVSLESNMGDFAEPYVVHDGDLLEKR